MGEIPEAQESPRLPEFLMNVRKNDRFYVPSDKRSHLTCLTQDGNEFGFACETGAEMVFEQREDQLVNGKCVFIAHISVPDMDKSTQMRIVISENFCNEKVWQPCRRESEKTRLSNDRASQILSRDSQFSFRRIDTDVYAIRKLLLRAMSELGY